MDRLRSKQGRKISMNLQDIIHSFKREFVTKNPDFLKKIRQNRRKELQSIRSLDKKQE